MTLSEEKIREIIEAGTPAGLYENKRVLVLTPDGTRTCPLPMMVRILREVIGERAARLDFMVALGTHPVMTEKQILELYGISGGSAGTLRPVRLLLPPLGPAGDLPTDRRAHRGRGGEDFRRPPAGAGADRHQQSHLRLRPDRHPGAGLPPRGGRVFRGGQVPFPRHLRRGVPPFLPLAGGADHLPEDHRPEGYPGPAGDPPGAGEDRPARPLPGDGGRSGGAAARPLHRRRPGGLVRRRGSVGSDPHRRKKKPFRIVLGRAPEMYDEIWTAGKVVYKLEQVVAPGGTLIVYAPHIREISSTWGNRSKRSATMSATISSPSRSCFAPFPAASWPIRPMSAGPGAMKTASRHPMSRWCWRRPSPKKHAGGSAWATWTRRRSGLPITWTERRRGSFRGSRRGDPLPPGGRGMKFEALATICRFRA